VPDAQGFQLSNREFCQISLATAKVVAGLVPALATGAFWLLLWAAARGRGPLAPLAKRKALLRASRFGSFAIPAAPKRAAPVFVAIEATNSCMGLWVFL